MNHVLPFLKSFLFDFTFGRRKNLLEINRMFVVVQFEISCKHLHKKRGISQVIKSCLHLPRSKLCDIGLPSHLKDTSPSTLSPMRFQLIYIKYITLTLPSNFYATFIKLSFNFHRTFIQLFIQLLSNFYPILTQFLLDVVTF